MIRMRSHPPGSVFGLAGGRGSCPPKGKHNYVIPHLWFDPIKTSLVVFLV